MTKNQTFPLKHSLACANYAIYAAIHACIVYVKSKTKCRKNSKSNDEKGGEQAKKAKPIIWN